MSLETKLQLSKTFTSLKHCFSPKAKQLRPYFNGLFPPVIIDVFCFVLFISFDPNSKS